jgi:hypothetical protein
MIYEKLISKLFPTGRAWLQKPFKIMTAIMGGIADELEKLKAEAELMRDSIFPDLMDEKFIPDWEERFKLAPPNGLAIQDRRDRLTAQWLDGEGQTREHIENKLRESGFDVYVTDGTFDAPFDSLLGEYVLGDFGLEGNVVVGDLVVADPCSQFSSVGTILGDFALGDNYVLDKNRPRIIVNHIDDSLENEDFCPLDVEEHKYVFYIQGEPGPALGEIATIPAARYLEFREIVLKYKPANSWALAFIQMV